VIRGEFDFGDDESVYANENRAVCFFSKLSSLPFGAIPEASENDRSPVHGVQIGKNGHSSNWRIIIGHGRLAELFQTGRLFRPSFPNESTGK